MLAFLFPGQGSQPAGMGRELYDTRPLARAVFAEADEVLGFALSKLCFDGPADALQLTTNAQPAILTVSIATLRAVEETTGLRPTAVAGHSLGEYSALVAAGVLSLADALRLVRRRGEAMQEAVPVGVGAMAAVVGADAAVVETMCRDAAQAEILQCANFNAPNQTVVSGHAAAVDRLIALAPERKCKAKKLPVSAPFHCQLMLPAAAQMADALAGVEYRLTSVPVIANVDAQPHQGGPATAALLRRQITEAVRWTESVATLRGLGVQRFLEVGPGRVLSGLLRQIDRTLEAQAVATPADLENLRSS